MLPKPCLTALLALAIFAPLGLFREQNDARAQPDDASPVRFTELLLQDKYAYAYGVAAADLDGDGHLDLTSVDSRKDIFYWFAGDGKGNFTRHFVGKVEPGLIERHAIGDINRDGKPDIAVVKNIAGELVWYENSGKPRQDENWKRRVIGKFPRAYDVTLVDLDGDGFLDAASSSYNGMKFGIFFNPGKDTEAAWTPHLLEDKLSDTRTIRPADLNGDGKPDLLGTVRNGDLVLWYENPGKRGTPWIKHVIDDKSLRPTHGHAIDMDGDGDLDIVMALGMLAPTDAKNTHQVVWYENLGKGKEWKRHVVGELYFAFEAFAADLDGDGKLDIVASAWGAKGKLVWFQNPGDPRKGPWKRYVLKETWPNANQVIAADLNADGSLDIIASAENGANEVRWWRNDGKPK